MIAQGRWASESPRSGSPAPARSLDEVVTELPESLVVPASDLPSSPAQRERELKGPLVPSDGPGNGSRLRSLAGIATHQAVRATVSSAIDIAAPWQPVNAAPSGAT